MAALIAAWQHVAGSMAALIAAWQHVAGSMAAMHHNDATMHQNCTKCTTM